MTFLKADKSMRAIIGIDTGGTYTDAVVYDAAGHRVIAKAKALTTRGDYAIGVGEAMAAAIAAAGGRAALPEIALVSVSTTLATNAIVEGQGSPIAVLLAGFDQRMIERAGIAAAVPGTPVLAIAGGHDHAGDEVAPLDLAAAEAFVARHAPAVDAFAVASQYSVRNPAHEAALGALVGRIAGKPVSLSHDLASALDAPRRALTAALNARLIGRITALVAAIRRAMAALGLDVPLMMVKGDGTMASAETILARPVETVLSGPAASVIGAKALSGLSDFVLSDVGGTTTDIAVLAGGWPRLDPSGAEVGGFRTMVRAVEMRTYGLGGDSEVDIDAQGRVKLGPRRCVPVSLLAHRFPALLERLKHLAQVDDPGPDPSRFVLRPFGHAAAPAAMLGDKERRLVERVGAEPVPVAAFLASHEERRLIERLVRAGHLQAAGFTPSCAAHVLGLQATWSREGAIAAAGLLWRSRRMGSAGAAAAERCARAVEAEMIAASARALLETLSGRPAGAPDPLFDAVAQGRPRLGGLVVALGPAVPLVAVGGPAGIAYPEVARRLGADLRLLGDGDVANAVGAAAGLVRGRAVVEVTSLPGGGYRLHHATGIEDAVNAGTALARAEALASAEARGMAAAMGAGAPAIEVRVDRIDLPHVTGDAGLVGALVTAEAAGAAAAAVETAGA
jgi:N-methylhydantoinase A/oxoprolinase/acetone carboxylase beta subunit